MRNQRILSAVLAVCLLTAALGPTLHTAKAANTMEAIPTTIGRISAKAGGATRFESIANNTPVYAIKQANGYYSNYMKLRDIAYYLDFDVVWSADEPNAMRLYTDRHYLDSWTAPGPATQTQVATTSTMDIYVDDVKVVADVHPAMIGYNNYFKVRDIAKVMDFWCEFGSDGGRTYVTLDYNYRYADEAALAAGATQSSYAKTVQYQSLVWYDGNIGTVSDTPVTYTLRDAWGNYDYTKLYLGYTHEGMNAVAQLMLDRNLINKDSSGVKQFDDGNKLNAYYRYPMIEFKRWYNVTANLLRCSDIRSVYGGLSSGGIYNVSNFGVNLVIRSIGKVGCGTDMEAGVLSVEYDADNAFAKAREVTLASDTVQRILERMNTLSCDEEKVQFLMVCAHSKIQYGDYSDFVDAKQEYVISKGWGPDAEFSPFSPSYETERDKKLRFEDIGKIWRDSKIYVGVCDDFSYVFENLCNAAGYYYAGIDERKRNHTFDVVWIPDEGRWIGFDATGASKIQMYRDEEGWWADRYETGHRIGISETFTPMTSTLDFFWMMEQIKPGGWLSSDVTQNP